MRNVTSLLSFRELKAYPLNGRGLFYVICTQSTTTTTMSHSPKLAILQSLDAMDQKQMDEVLLYIKGILTQPARTIDYRTFKRQALKEIRQALRGEKKKGLRLTTT